MSYGDAAGEPVTIVVVDDHRVFSRGLELLLNSEGGRQVKVVASTADAGEAAGLVELHRPRVALVDLQMPPPGGLSALRAIKARRPATATIALTGLEDDDSGMAALSAGADGYIVKSAEPAHLIPPILAVAAGMAVLPGWLRDRLLAGVQLPRPDLSHLSQEQLVILRMIAAGRETKEIAAAIAVSDRTAKRLMAGLLRNLGVTHRVQAAVLATQAGLVEIPGHA
jgi:DNA-binding NarL/FixJ family response regulator